MTEREKITRIINEGISARNEVHDGVKCILIYGADETADAILAALPPREPEGWRLVPEWPEQEQIAAYIAADPRRKRRAASAQRDYRAMLAAAPIPPDREEGE